MLKPPRQLVVLWLQASQGSDKTETVSVPALLQNIVSEEKLSAGKVVLVGPHLLQGMPPNDAVAHEDPPHVRM